MDGLGELDVAAYPVAVAPDVDEVAAVEQPVQECGGQHLDAEHAAPLLEALVGRQDGGGAPVAPVDELEEEDRAALVARQVVSNSLTTMAPPEAGAEPFGRIASPGRSHRGIPPSGPRQTGARRSAPDTRPAEPE